MNLDPKRRGRRDNGLDATTFAPLADVDPRVGEHLLDVLWAAGVPAYLEPAADMHPTRAVTVPSPPTDRLWVDSSRRAEAWSVIRADTPSATSWPNDDPDSDRADDNGPRSSGAARDCEHDRTDLRADEQSAWDALVADFDRTADAGTPHAWPDAEDLAAPPRRAGDADRSTHPGASSADTAEPRRALPQRFEPMSGPRDWSPTAGDGLFDEDDDHFRPPTPPPLPRLSMEAAGALLLILAGIFLLVAPGVIGMSGNTPFGLGVLGIVAGTGLLIWRLRSDRSDDPDEGARV
ncbi:MAG: hypothetical protein ACR2F6_12000 [Mycobacteriales bacterium]